MFRMFILLLQACTLLLLYYYCHTFGRFFLILLCLLLFFNASCCFLDTFHSASCCFSMPPVVFQTLFTLPPVLFAIFSAWLNDHQSFFRLFFSHHFFFLCFLHICWFFPPLFTFFYHFSNYHFLDFLNADTLIMNLLWDSACVTIYQRYKYGSSDSYNIFIFIFSFDGKVRMKTFYLYFDFVRYNILYKLLK
jgi:hypothetical protein